MTSYHISLCYIMSCSLISKHITHTISHLITYIMAFYITLDLIELDYIRLHYVVSYSVILSYHTISYDVKTYLDGIATKYIYRRSLSGHAAICTCLQSSRFTFRFTSCSNPSWFMDIISLSSCSSTSEHEDDSADANTPHTETSCQHGKRSCLMMFEHGLLM